MLKWTKWFGNGCKGETMALSLSTQQKLNETLDVLDRRKLALQEKIAIENERLKGFTKFRNKKASAECVKRKSFYESQLEQLENIRTQVTDQVLPKSFDKNVQGFGITEMEWPREGFCYNHTNQTT